jgi:hypothetical protein
VLFFFPGPHRLREQVFFVFYKGIVDVPCAVILRVVKPSGEEVPGKWSDPISPATAEPSAWQSLWALRVAQFQERQEANRRLLEALATPGPLWDLARHPELEDEGDSAAWVKQLRGESAFEKRHEAGIVG